MADNIAEIDAGAQSKSLVVGKVGESLGGFLLDINRALDGINDTPN